MKTIINKFLLLVTLFAGAASLHGCSDPDGIIEDIAYGREFSPLNFTHTLSNNVNVTFSWTVMAGIADYTLTLSYADGEGGVYDQVDLIAPLDGDGNTVKTMEYSFRELPGNREWIAELVAVSQRAGVADSKPAACAFVTGVENLFLNDGKMGDGDVTATTAMLRWVAGSNVTHLDVTPDVGLIKLTSAQIAAGEYELTGLVTGTSYTVGLLRDEAVRGTISFVASDKIDVDVVDKGATRITLAWGADRQVTSLVLTGDDDERNVTLTDAEVAAHTYTFEGLKARTEYSISVYIAGVESGSLVVTTLGQSSLWDFTTGWQPVSWETDQTIDGLTILAASGKNVEIREDADYGCNYLDLRGKSTVKEGEAPSQRAVQFSVVGEGVIAIDCYANGAGRNFYAHVDALGKSFGPVEAPTADNRGKVYIPCPGIPASAASISARLGLVLGCGGVKMVQQSSYGSMEVSKVPILREIAMISVLSMPISGRRIGRFCAASVQAMACMVWLATCARLSPVIKASISLWSATSLAMRSMLRRMSTVNNTSGALSRIYSCGLV